MPQPQDSLAERFRSAVLSGDHAGAEKLAVQYVEAVRRMWVSLPEQERAASQVPKQSQELLGWARDVTIVQRALAREHSAILDKTCRYQPSGWTESRSRAVDVQI